MRNRLFFDPQHFQKIGDMAFLLLHQNMQNYGGGILSKTKKQGGGFVNISFSSSDILLVAGFTEILNDTISLNGLRRFAGNLSSELDRLSVIGVGGTIGGRYEYIGISWNSSHMNVEYGGQVLLIDQGSGYHKWEAKVTPAINGFLPDTIDTPPKYGGDNRGPAFIAGIFNGKPTIIMFFHNMYRDEGSKFGNYQRLPDMAEDIKEKLKKQKKTKTNYDQAKIVIGGDFNVTPDTYIFPPFKSCAAKSGGAYVNTTNVHPYDFWLFNNQLNCFDNQAKVYEKTRRGPGSPDLSDHAAITLQLL